MCIRDRSIHDGELLQHPVLVKNMNAAIEAGKAIHLMGLVGTGGVHSHADHWFGVLEMAKHLGAKEVYLHCITDGRDTDPVSYTHLGGAAPVQRLSHQPLPRSRRTLPGAQCRRAVPWPC